MRLNARLRAVLPPLFGLAPGGVYPAACVAAGAVRSCRPVSPLPSAHGFPCASGGLFSVALSLGSPPPAVSRHRIPVEPGLSSPALAGSSGRPAVWPGVCADNQVARQPAAAAPFSKGGGRKRCFLQKRAAYPPLHQSDFDTKRSATATARAIVAASAVPVTCSGCQWRWKAVTTSVGGGAPKGTS